MPESNQENYANSYGKLDEQTLIFRQLDRLGRLSTEVENLYESDLDVYAHRFQMGVLTLHSLLEPLIDDKFKEFHEKQREKIESGEIDEKDYRKRIRINQKILKKLIELLYRNNIYWGEQENIVVDETKEGEEEAYTID